MAGSDPAVREPPIIVAAVRRQLRAVKGLAADKGWPPLPPSLGDETAFDLSAQTGSEEMNAIVESAAADRIKILFSDESPEKPVGGYMRTVRRVRAPDKCCAC
jgi:hypothetical protein